jgi:PelA/Pel-15E family pectate lyase
VKKVKKQIGVWLSTALLMTSISVLPANAATIWSDNFNDGNASGWSTQNGSWSVVQDNGNYVYYQSSSNEGRASAGSQSWTNYTIEAKVKVDNFNGSNRVYVAGRYKDGNNYYAASLYNSSGGKLEIRKKVGGSSSTLASKSYALSTGTWYNVKLEMSGSTIKMYVNGTLQLTATDSSLTSGGAGLVSFKALAKYDDVVVSDGAPTSSPTPTPTATPTPAPTATPTPTPTPAPSTPPSSEALNILNNQQSDGGWRKDYSVTSGTWAKSTIDNGATYTEIRTLAAEYARTRDSRLSNAVIKGINFLLNMQYANGGWPQIYQSSGYHQHITYNDDAMINVMILLDDVANKRGNFSFVDNTLADRSRNAVTKGVQCLLNTQIVVNGQLTAWGQQHDSVTLKPAGARAYEVPSLSGKESVGIVKFLKTRPSTPAIAASIQAAENWMRAVKITGIKVVKTSDDVVVVSDSSAPPIWARFYEIGTNRAIFVGRDGVVKYQLKDIEQERRTGYSWYGYWPSSLGL